MIIDNLKLFFLKKSINIIKKLRKKYYKLQY